MIVMYHINDMEMEAFTGIHNKGHANKSWKSQWYFNEMLIFLLAGGYDVG